MIHFLALSLVFTSLLAAHVWSPNPANREDDVLVKQGHRVVVVESFDQNGHYNTKVSISPPQDPISAADGKFPSNIVDNAKDKVKQGFSSVVDSIPKFTGEGHSADELIRNAVDNCKDCVSGALHKAKDQVSETVHEGVAMKKEAAFKAKDKVENAYGKAKEKASETAHATEEVFGKTKEKASEVVENAYGSAREKATEKAHVAKELVQDAYGKAREKATEKAHESVGTAREKASETIHGAKEAVEDAYEKTKDFAHDTRDLGKTIGNDAARNVTKQVGNLKNLCLDGIGYLISGNWVDPLFGVVDLLGFAIAYGMGMWVTFISNHVLAGSLPRHQFGLVQSKIYPVYFRAMGSSIVIALLGHIGVHRKHLLKAGGLQVVNLLATLLTVLINACCLEPLATKVMMEKLRLEKEEGRGRETERSGAGEAAVSGVVEPPAIAEAERQEIRERMGRMSERLKRLNAYSSLLNIATLMALSWHLVHLGHCIHRTTS